MAYALSAQDMVELIARYGLPRMADVTKDAAKMLVAALGEDGIPAPLNWRAEQTNGAVLFVQVERSTGVDGKSHVTITSGERILCVNAPESERARYEAETAGSDAPVRVLMRPQLGPLHALERIHDVGEGRSGDAGHGSGHARR